MLKLDTILENQERLELVINGQDSKILELEKLGRRITEVDPIGKKEKGKAEFYHVNIYDTVFCTIYLCHFNINNRIIGRNKNLSARLISRTWAPN